MRMLGLSPKLRKEDRNVQMYSEGAPCDLIKLEYYHGELTKKQAKRILEECGGRVSFTLHTTRNAVFLSVRHDGDFISYEIERYPGKYKLRNEEASFEVIQELVSYYQNQNEESGIFIGEPCTRDLREAQSMLNAAYHQYEDIDDSGEYESDSQSLNDTLKKHYYEEIEDDHPPGFYNRVKPPLRHFYEDIDDEDDDDNSISSSDELEYPPRLARESWEHVTALPMVHHHEYEDVDDNGDYVNSAVLSFFKPKSTDSPPPVAPKPKQRESNLTEVLVRSLMPYWYRPKMSRDIAIETVLGLLSGEFIVRDSSTVIGGYALTLKLNEDSLRMWKKMDASDVVKDKMLVTHFLLETTSEGIRLKGWSEKPFKDLPAFITGHVLEKLCFPCKLVLPTLPQLPQSPASLSETSSLQPSPCLQSPGLLQTPSSLPSSPRVQFPPSPSSEPSSSLHYPYVQFPPSPKHLQAPSSSLIPSSLQPLHRVPVSPQTLSSKPVSRISMERSRESFVRSSMMKWYQPHMSRTEAIESVSSMPTGSFIVRDSSTVAGGYALTMKINKLTARQKRNMRDDEPISEDMLVTNFLIQPVDEGVKLVGWNEGTYENLAAFVAGHTTEKLCLPCRLKLPKSEEVYFGYFGNGNIILPEEEDNVEEEETSREGVEFCTKRKKRNR